ncbi:MAG: SynChlorMet cassette radical SAM/SPASM protein ScmE [Thermodesulfobacteriota bacterium]
MQGWRTPFSADLAITSRCNLRCSYCSHFTSAGDVGEDLPKEEWLRFFGELKECYVFSVALQGAEPFFRKDLPELIEGIVGNRMRYSILSNGTLIHEEMAAFLASTNRCDGVQVSIDSAVPATHDAFRGQGSFSRAIRGIEALRTYGVPVSVRVTIHTLNVPDIEETARFLLEDMGLPGFSTNAASYLGLCRQNSAAVQLTADERTLVMKKLLLLNRRYPGRISGTAGPLADALMWVDMERAREEGREDLPGGGCLSACGGPFEKIAVRSDGIIVPCIQMAHLKLGRINEVSLKEVWQGHETLKRLRNRSRIPLSEFKFCRGCDYVPYCTGNCPALAYTITGDEYHPSPDACLRRFLKDGGRLPALDLG